MKWTDGLLYKNQATAEAVADQWRNRHRALLAKLEALNETVLDSVRLQKLINEEQEPHA